jgi:hypothetical protein
MKPISEQVQEHNQAIQELEIELTGHKSAAYHLLKPNYADRRALILELLSESPCSIEQVAEYFSPTNASPELLRTDLEKMILKKLVRTQHKLGKVVYSVGAALTLSL